MRQTGAKFRSFFENAVEGIFRSTPSGKIVAANPALAHMLGYGSPAELMATISDIRAQLHVEPNRRVEFTRLLEKDGSVRRFEAEVYRKDGSTIWVSVNARAVRDTSGRLLYYEGTAEDITDRKRIERRLAAQYTITRVLAEAASLAEATAQLLQVICESLGWDTGELWSVDPGANQIHYIENWHATSLDVAEFIAISRRTAFALGVGLPGRVWQSGRPIWIPNVLTDTNFPRAAAAAKVGLHGAFAFPILLGSQTLGAMLFLSREIRPPDEDLLEVMSAIGNQIGQFIERKRAEERLRRTSEQLRALSIRLQSAREEEGTRIARELHDELGSALTSLKWDLEGIDRACSEAKSQVDLPMLREKIKTMMALIDATINSVRRISSELRPSVLDDLGLVAAIEWQAQQFEARTGIRCRCDSFIEHVDLSKEQATAVFRILQEALTNILRHAQATGINIVIEGAEEFALTVSDNGRGITESEKTAALSLGLLGMQERAHLIGGEVHIAGTEGKGTVVTVRVPISGL